MYTRLATAAAAQPALSRSGFDMFAVAKTAGWHKCTGVAAELALAVQQLHQRLGGQGAADPQQLRLALAEVVQVRMDRWGMVMGAGA